MRCKSDRSSRRLDGFTKQRAVVTNRLCSCSVTVVSSCLQMPQTMRRYVVTDETYWRSSRRLIVTAQGDSSRRKVGSASHNSRSSNHTPLPRWALCATLRVWKPAVSDSRQFRGIVNARHRRVRVAAACSQCTVLNETIGLTERIFS